MSKETTLFAQIVPKFTERTEDVAVEALGYILSQSNAARRALENTLREGGAAVGSIARVRTQVTGGKRERPDLAGLDVDGAERVLIEAKFWAERTKNQPNEYLKRLPKDRPAALLFVAPTARLETLWPELCRSADQQFTVIGATTPGDLRAATVSGGERRLMLTSWAALLDLMESESKFAGDVVAERDIQQLRGLTDCAEPDPFLPWRPEEMGPEFARRMEGLRRLVDDAISHGKNAGFLNRGSVAAGGGGGYGRQIQLGGVAAGFGIEIFAWARYCNTPLWLRFGRDKYGQLKQAGLTDEMFDPGPTWDFRIPIKLPAGVDYDKVLSSVVSRLKSIARLFDPDSIADEEDDSDIGLLSGSADRMDPFAFLPWRPEELEPNLAQQVTGLHGLIDDAISRGNSAGFLQPTKVVPRQEGYGQAFLLGDLKAWLGIHFGGWARHYDTSLWLTFEYIEQPKQAIMNVDVIEIGGKHCIPIEIPATAEHDEVLDSVVASLERIAGQLEASDA